MDRVTIEAVRALLADKVLIGPKRQRQRIAMPGTPGLAYLTVRLTDWRKRIASMQRAAALDKRRATIRDRLIEVAAEIAALCTQAPECEHQGLAALAHEVEMLAWCRWTRPQALWHDWRPYAAALATEFVAAMQMDNPDLHRFGIGHTGPVARYVAAVLPLIADDTAPSVQTVATFMRDERASDPQRYWEVCGNHPTPTTKPIGLAL